MRNSRRVSTIAEVSSSNNEDAVEEACSSNGTYVNRWTEIQLNQMPD